MAEEHPLDEGQPLTPQDRDEVLVGLGDFDAGDEDDPVGERPCGCPPDYHLADCPHRTGGWGPQTKEEVLERWGHLYPDDCPDEEGGY